MTVLTVFYAEIWAMLCRSRLREPLAGNYPILGMLDGRDNLIAGVSPSNLYHQVLSTVV